MERLTPEQQAKAESIETAQEALAFAQEEGIELTDDELEQISGGWNKLPKKGARKTLNCPSCGAHISVAPDATECPGCGAAI